MSLLLVYSSLAARSCCVTMRLLAFAFVLARRSLPGIIVWSLAYRLPLAWAQAPEPDTGARVAPGPGWFAPPTNSATTLESAAARVAAAALCLAPRPWRLRRPFSMLRRLARDHARKTGPA